MKIAFSLVSLVLASTLTSNAAEPMVHSFDLTGARAVPFHVEFTSDLTGCAVVGTNGTVQSRNMQTGAILAEIASPADPQGGPLDPFGFAFIPPSGQIVVGGGTNLSVHDARTGAKTRSLEPAPSRIGSIQVSPDGHHVAARPGHATLAGLTFWNLPTGQRLRHLPTDCPPGAYNIRMRHGTGLPQVPAPEWMEPNGRNAFAPTGHRFFSVLEGADVDVWDLDQARCLGTWHPGPTRGRASAIVALDDHRVANSVNDHELRVIDPIANTKTILIAGHPIPGPTALEIRDLALSGDGRRLAVAGMRMKSRPAVMAPAGDVVYDVPLRGEVQVWDVATAKVLTTLQGRPTEKFVKVAVDHTGSRVAAVHNGVSIQANWTTATQQHYARNPTEPLRVTVWDLPGGN